MPALLAPTEYRNTANAQDTENLIIGGDSAAQTAELARRIDEATGWMENKISQHLVAAQRIETVQVKYRPDGTLFIRSKDIHLNQLIAVAVGTDASNLTAVSSLAGAWINKGLWVIPPAGGFVALAGLQFSTTSSLAGTPLVAKLTHVTGWPNTTLTAAANTGDTNLTVASTVGFQPALGSTIADDQARIIDGELDEPITVASVTSATVLHLSSPLQNSHDIGATVTMVPPDLKLAAHWATSAFLLDRSADSFMPGQLPAPNTTPTQNQLRRTLLADAVRTLVNYSRIR